MSKSRMIISITAGVCALLLLLGTVISFFIQPSLSDEMKASLPEGALATDSARTPWLSATKDGRARVHSEQCVYLKELVIPEVVNDIVITGFYDVPDGRTPSWIKKIVLPSTMRNMGEFPFHEWDGLEEIVFKDGIEDLSKMHIGTRPNLKKLVIPASVTGILRPWVLEDTPSEQLEIHYGGTEAEWAALGEHAAALAEKYTVVYESNG